MEVFQALMLHLLFIVNVWVTLCICIWAKRRYGLVGMVVAGIGCLGVTWIALGIGTSLYG